MTVPRLAAVAAARCWNVLALRPADRTGSPARRAKRAILAHMVHLKQPLAPRIDSDRPPGFEPPFRFRTGPRWHRRDPIPVSAIEHIHRRKVAGPLRPAPHAIHSVLPAHQSR